jgi:hypothetical protein
MNRTTIVVPFFIMILSACGKSGGDSDPLPGPNNNALGLRASDCGEHVWEKYFGFLGTPGPVDYSRDTWPKRTASILTWKAGGKSTITSKFSNDPRCQTLDRSLSTGVGEWKSDEEFQVLGTREVIKKGDLFTWRYSIDLETSEQIPSLFEGFDLDVLAGKKQMTVNELKVTLDIGIGRGDSDYSRSSKFENIELSCKKPFTYEFTYRESLAQVGPCRKRENSTRYDCVRAQIAFTGDDCTIKGSDLRIIDENGTAIALDIGGALTLGKNAEGNPNYILSISSVTFK